MRMRRIGVVVEKEEEEQKEQNKDGLAPRGKQLEHARSWGTARRGGEKAKSE